MNNKDPLIISYFYKIVLCIVVLFVIKYSNADTNVYKQIKSWNPKFPKHKAHLISFYIYKHSFEKSINPSLLTAILIQESSLRLDAQNYSSNDFGIGQINIKTAKHFCPHIQKLLTNYDYSVGCAAKVLKDFKKRYKKREKTWWTRYNSSSNILRRRYKELVTRHRR